MSRDGRGELITVAVTGYSSVTPLMPCGERLLTAHGGQLRACEAGHVHCVRCGAVAKKFRKGWTHVCQA